MSITGKIILRAVVLSVVATGACFGEEPCPKSAQSATLGGASDAADGALVAARRLADWPGVEPAKCDTVHEWMPEPNPNDEPVKAGEKAASDPRCPSGTQRVADFCMDQFLGSLVAVHENGTEDAWSPFHDPARFKDAFNRSVGGCAQGAGCPWGAKYSGGSKIVRFRSVSIKDAVPQSNVSRFSAAAACEASGKRLCSKTEYLRACEGGGKKKRYYPYPTGGTSILDKVWGQCHDLMLGVPKASYGTMAQTPSRTPRFYKPCLACRQNEYSEECGKCPDAWDLERKPFMNTDMHPPGHFLKQFGGEKGVYTKGLENACVAEVPRFVGRNGSKPDCHTPDSDGGIYDLIGNKHEWTSETLPNGNGVFRGGYMDDTVLNGPGCAYATVRHGPQQSDISTGFRCCSDLRASP